MEPLNTLLMKLTLSQRSWLYYSFLALGCLSNLCAVLYLSGKYSIDKKARYCFAPICALTGALATALSFGTENTVFGISTGNSMLLYILICLVTAKKCGISTGKSLDITAPANIAGRGVLAIGCTFPGCCHGIPFADGIYSDLAEAIVFPCNQMESTVSFLLAFVCLRVAEKTGYKGEGRIGACALAVFGILRFVSDLFRANDKFFGRTSYDGIVAAIMCITGLVLLYLIDNKKLQSLHTSEVSIN